jgi:two-component system LytT family response regulator
MIPIRTLLVDDDQANLGLMKVMFEKNFPEVEIIELCHSPEDALEAITNYSPDLVFIDIEMPGITGFELLEKLRHNDFDVIFITAHDEYSLQAFKFSAIDYLIKPPKVEDIRQAIDRIVQRRNSYVTLDQMRQLMRNLRNQLHEKPRLALNTHEKVIFIQLDEIVRCEANGVYTMFHLTDGRKQMVSKNIQKYEEILVSHGFYRAHRSHIVNIDFVREFVKEGEGHLVMKDNSKVDVSRYRRDDILKKLGK